MSRISFWKIFQINPDGTLQPIVRVSIGGFILEPGQKIQKGVAFSGFDLFQYTGRDLEVNKQGDVEVLTGVY